MRRTCPHGLEGRSALLNAMGEHFEIPRKTGSCVDVKKPLVYLILVRFQEHSATLSVSSRPTTTPTFVFQG